MHVHIVPLLAFLHMYVCLYVCNQSNQIKSNQIKSGRRFRNHLIIKSNQKKMMVGVNIRILTRHVKFDNDIVKWELFFVTVDQRVRMASAALANVLSCGQQMLKLQSLKLAVTAGV